MRAGVGPSTEAEADTIHSQKPGILLLERVGAPVVRSRCMAMVARKEGSLLGKGRLSRMLSQILPQAPYSLSCIILFSRALGSHGHAQNSARRHGRVTRLRCKRRHAESALGC